MTMPVDGPDRAPARAALPHSILTWLPFLWSNVLFPSPVAEPSRLRWTALLWLVLLPGVLLYPCLSFHLFEPDEGRYAEIPREMLNRGDWVVPYLQSEPYLDKPPLMYWLLMGSYTVLGVQVWACRLVPALAVHLCILLTYLIGRRSVGERPAFWGAVALGLAPGFVSIGRLLVLDGLLTLWTTVSILSAFEALRHDSLRWRWWLLAAATCGLGVLTKGPVAIALLLPPLWLYRRLQVSASSCGISWRAWLAFGAVTVAVPLPWYLAICLRAPEFAGHFFWEHNVVRFLAPFDHLRPFWFYIPIVVVGMLPASLLAWPFLRFLLSSDEACVRRRSPELGFLLLGGGWCVLFFTLSGCKLPTYVLPAFPLLALALGVYVAGSRWAHSHWTQAALGCAFIAVGVGHYLALPWYAEHHSPVRDPEQLAQVCRDRQTPIICYPRNCDSVAFHLRRDDLVNFRSKQTPSMIQFLQKQPRTVILFTHRHSLDALRQVLPPELRLTNERPLCGSARRGVEGTCYLAVVERHGRRTP